MAKQSKYNPDGNLVVQGNIVGDENIYITGDADVTGNVVITGTLQVTGSLQNVDPTITNQSPSTITNDNTTVNSNIRTSIRPIRVNQTKKVVDLLIFVLLLQLNYI